MIAWAEDNTSNDIPGIRGTCGDEMDDLAGPDRDGGAGLYFPPDADFTQDADPNTVGRGDAATAEAFDGCVYTAYGEAPILDPDKAAQPDARPPGRDRSPFAGYLFDDAAESYQVRNRSFHPAPGQW